ncbi:hypothetical protein [Acetobacter oeni]|uniref:Uncharacterized protein n=1 Tax=Acetobacter oeni TaxID=304077 RepID=A0A511XFP2_9PROT|nr:hypothetical protein [Acetobacter oeni]MBB3882297.1 hypothetical protein [Acetobacter oeni]NHO18050.1 hypothetical protein [Acetobacter oeni]GBR01074.1 hypothetical protein AA21952_0304 [Acetobacter oeni LMG 21952]GEN61783.1 hypothetical protein AOE01nite_00070 [Acetobacter oeni]
MSQYFFDGWLGLLIEGGTELVASGYSRTAVQFAALNGTRETRPVAQPIVSTETAWSTIYEIALFERSEGSDLPVLRWPVSRWTLGGTTNSFAVPDTDTHLLLQTPEAWPPGSVIGRTAAGESVTVGSDVSFVPGISQTTD